MKIWGRVANIGDRQLTVSLPAGLTGTVKLAEASVAASKPPRQRFAATPAPLPTALASLAPPQASDEFKKLANTTRKPKKPKTPDAKKRRLSSADAADGAGSGDDGSSSSDDDNDEAAEAEAAAEPEAAGPTLKDAFFVGQLICAIVARRPPDRSADARTPFCGQHLPCFVLVGSMVGP